MAVATYLTYHFAMMEKFIRTAGYTSVISAVALLVTLTGCNKSPPDVQAASAPAAPGPATVVQGQPTVAVQDDYVYYPAYEVYYSSSRHDYRYRDGDAWVSRPAPPRVSVDVLFASPSVRLDFHDAPDRHHERVIRSYPKNWVPPDRDRGGRDERKDDRKEKR